MWIGASPNAPSQKRAPSFQFRTPLRVPGPSNALPFSCNPAAESAPRFYTMSLRRDCQLQRLVRRQSPPPPLASWVQPRADRTLLVEVVVKVAIGVQEVDSVRVALAHGLSERIEAACHFRESLHAIQMSHSLIGTADQVVVGAVVRQKRHEPRQFRPRRMERSGSVIEFIDVN